MRCRPLRLATSQKLYEWLDHLISVLEKLILHKLIQTNTRSKTLLPQSILPEKLPVSGFVKKSLSIEPGELLPCAQCDLKHRAVLWICLLTVMSEILTQQHSFCFSL
jgi:hypothetical protein